MEAIIIAKDSGSHLYPIITKVEEIL